MADIPTLMDVQIGKEVTWGTAVPQTAKLALVTECELQPEIEAEVFQDLRSTMAPGYVASLKTAKATAKLSGICTYEDMPYLFDSIAGTATPSGANPYVYAYTGPLGTVPTRRMMTLAKGQGTNIHSMVGSVVKDLSIKIEAGKEVTYEANLIGKKIATDTLDALSDRTVNPVMANHFALYIDAVGGTIGTTVINTTWFSYELKLESQAETYFGIGNLNPANYREDRWKTTLNLVLELDATSKAYLDSIIGTSLLQHQIRAKATDTTRILQLDTAIAWLKSPALHTDSDGVVTLEYEGEGIYNTPLANYFKASVTNAVASLP